MPLGAGRYDELCTLVRRRAHAEGAIVIIMEGDKGSGFSLQGTAEVVLRLPQILRNMADEIDKEHGRA